MCHDPISINNTYLLETKFKWRGLSIDLDKLMTEKYNVRNTCVLNKDCTKLDFEEIISICTNKIDYLSLDLEPASTTYRCLETIPFNELEFSIITYEHDLYRFGEEWKIKSRNLIEFHGYKRICSDVSNLHNIYEDWYFNPKFVDYNRIKVLESESLEWSNILFR